jgi:ribonuclease BN (tRNA processing enzyme)
MEADGRRLAYTADTAPCDGLSDLATDADLLLSEATLRTLDEDASRPSHAATSRRPRRATRLGRAGRDGWS